MLNEIRAVTRRQASAVTCVTTDVDCNYVISGDASKYNESMTVLVFTKRSTFILLLLHHVIYIVKFI